MKIKYVLIICASLFLMGCEDLNTFCPKDINNSNDNNESNATGINCEKSDYDYCKMIVTDNNDSFYMCSDDSDFKETCNFSECNCEGTSSRLTDCICSDDSLTQNSLSAITSSNTDFFQSGTTSGSNSGSCPDSSSCSGSSSCTGSSSGSCPDSSSCSGSSTCTGSSSSSCSTPSSSPSSSSSPDSDTDTDQSLTYHLHTDIQTTLFWIGEANSNYSVWDNDWMMHYGGIDTPEKRTEYYPEAFTPDENPFYAALPYNDLDNNRELKPNIQSYIPWATDNDDPGLSICKNRWIMITAHRKSAYAQWEDTGSSGNNDINYVFGDSDPLVGDFAPALAISPAVRDYLGLDQNDTAAWKFVDFTQVPSGPWKDIVTTSISN